jgi:hypothetical protein
MRILLFLLSLGCISEGLAQELFSEQFTPLTRLTKPNAKEKSGSIDSTFIFASDTLQLPVFDDFSTNKFQFFQGAYNGPGVTSQTYYRLLDVSNNQPIPNNLNYTNQITFRRTYDAVTDTYTDVNFPSVPLIQNNLTVFPPIATPISVYPPYFIYDTVGIPDVSDTVWIANPSFFQDSAMVFFQTISDTSKIWIDRMALRNDRYGVNPRSLGVATFDGLDDDGYPYQFGSAVTNYGDRLTSKPIDLTNYSASDSLYFSFLYQPEGLGDIPEAGDSLVLEFYASGQDQWFHVWGVAGSGIHPFRAVHLPLTQANFLTDGFRFRFRNYGGLSGSLDHFHIDYVHLRALSSYNDTLFKDFALCYPVSSLLENYTSVPWDHYKNTASNVMENGLEIKVYNGSNAAENYQNGQIEILQGGVQQGTFSLPGFLLAEGNINYNPSTYYTSYHDLSMGYEFNRLLPGDYQTFDIKTTVSAQFPNLISNDSCSFTQGFYNYYSYDDGSAEAAFGPTGAQSMLAVHFNAYEADSLLGVYLHFVPSVVDVSNKLFYLTVWEDNNGIPGNLLYQDDVFSPRQPTYNQGLNNFNPYYFAGGIKVPVSTSFFVGWKQVDALRYNLGLDRNIDHSDEIFYSVDFGGTWQNPPFAGSPMLRPIFSTALDAVLNLTSSTEEKKYRVFPNPSNIQAVIESPYPDEEGYLIFGLTGQKNFEIEGNILHVEGLAPGYYLIKSKIHQHLPIKFLRVE